MANQIAANPIIKPGTFFAGYSDSYQVRLPDEYLRGALPASYTDRPNKSVDSPITSYHHWYAAAGQKMDAVEQRKYLLKVIMSGKSVAPTTGVLQYFTSPTQAAHGKTVKKVSDKSDKTQTPKSSDNKTDQPEYIFEDSTVRFTALPNQQQLALYKKPITLPTEADTSDNSPTGSPKVPKNPADLTNGVVPATNDQVFDAMTSLAWRDKDEGLMNASTLNRVSTVSLASAYPTMIKLADELFLAIHEKTGALDDANTEDKYNFLFHVIAKGEAMYFQTIADPEFCLYLLEQYQPLYTYMKKKLKIKGEPL